MWRFGSEPKVLAKGTLRIDMIDVRFVALESHVEGAYAESLDVDRVQDDESQSYVIQVLNLHVSLLSSGQAEVILNLPYGRAVRMTPLEYSVHHVEQSEWALASRSFCSLFRVRSASSKFSNGGNKCVVIRSVVVWSVESFHFLRRCGR